MTATRLAVLTPEFVDLVPRPLLPGILYVSEWYKTAIHACACGCGAETVTPTGRGGWTLTRSGDAVTLRPSIGNQNFPCRSHYYVTANRVEWL